MVRVQWTSIGIRRLFKKGSSKYPNVAIQRLLEDLRAHLADRSYARWIRGWQAAGYRVSLWFLSLPSPESALARVAERVGHGGHSVPDAVVRRRFAAGLENFEKVYKSLVDDWGLYDNAGEEPFLLDWGERR